ncbi:MAG: hypothetical protein J1F02_02765 [Lachnospiraceae bacterium]|nr:hypothetical protein [Lachnospiraceae bacterium]
MCWEFPINNGGQFHGIGDSGIDLFKGDPMKGLTREICQNSIDARVNDKEAVRVEFKAFEIDADCLPQRKQLLAYYQEVYEFCKSQEFAKATEYFERTIPILQRPRIQMLRISDFNTSGLVGADVAAEKFTTPWYRLVRSVGSSDKVEGSIGAFGSGKQACFSCSDIQTVFYSTYDENKIEAYQGVSKLISFMDADNNLHSDVGYYSSKNCMPFYEQFKIDVDFDRNEPGTDVYIVAFKSANSDWKKELVVAVLDGYLYAIKEGHLVVQIDDILIDCEHVSELIEQYKNDISNKTYDYYCVLNNADSEIRYFSYIEENDVELHMLMKPDLHRRVAMIRFPGMKVFDKGSISATVSFAGICIIRGKKISKLLGGLENIQHNAWELSRYRDEPENQVEAQAKIKKIYGDIKKLFNELKGQDTEGEIDPEIGDCLPDPMSDKEENQESIKDEVLEIRTRSSKPVEPHSALEIEDENGDDGTDGGTSGGVGVHVGGGHITEDPDPGPGPGDEPGDNPVPSQSSIESKIKKKVQRVPATIRYFVEDAAKGEYEINITPKEYVKDGQIIVFMSAETDKYKADIKMAKTRNKNLDISGNIINGINLEKGVKTAIQIKFDYSDICSLEVIVYGH